MQKRNFILILTLLFFIFVVLPALASENNLNPSEFTMHFPSKEMTLKKALDVLFLQKEFNIVYGGKEIDIDVPIVFTSRTLKLKEALNQIEKQAPIEFIINNKHIIVKKRELKSKYILSGRITDATTHEGLVAANVIIEGTTTGVVTNSNGSFNMPLAPGIYNIIVRYIGYNEQTIRVNLFRDIDLNISMVVKENQIQTIDVTGKFSVIENLEKGRPIEMLESKIMDKLTTNNVSDALHARLNGVWTTKVSGAPGDHLKIRIRGISSIFGNTDPLFVVDGTMIPIVNFENLGIADLNVHDIEKITVLKDASSTALYGNLGGNGVVLIETKKGGGKNELSFQVKQGFQQFTKRYDLMGAEDFYGTLKSADELINTKFYYRDPSRMIYEKYPEYLDSLGNPLPETDFQEMLFQIG
ncbi:MAG: carboxypeptidase-like regulatory domain-containing protein, partial [Prolixibacteraceae bacterium]|nr:carboxypeptidase-like regulatory domain-containing protein [Prolixibacteraceae bacterium]